MGTKHISLRFHCLFRMKNPENTEPDCWFLPYKAFGKSCKGHVQKSSFLSSLCLLITIFECTVTVRTAAAAVLHFKYTNWLQLAHHLNMKRCCLVCRAVNSICSIILLFFMLLSERSVKPNFANLFPVFTDIH